MATNNYYGYPTNGTYNSNSVAPGSGSYQSTYPVQPPAPGVGPNSYRAGYEQFQSAGQHSSVSYATSSSPAVSYDYGYGRPTATADVPQTSTTHFDNTKSYYQQQQSSAVSYSSAAQSYDTNNSVKNNYQSVPYAAIPPQQQQRHIGGQSQQQQLSETNQQTTGYSNYDAALYSAATMFVAQQTGQAKTNSWQSSGGSAGGNGPANSGPYGRKAFQGVNKLRAKPQPKPQQLHYCDVCKISCAGPQTYREHLDGQKHKKRETTLKAAQTSTGGGGGVSSASAYHRANNLRCELCDVTCTGADAYAAHVRGTKHQKVVKLHQRLGKPIPEVQPVTFVQSANLTTTAGSTGPAAAAAPVVVTSAATIVAKPTVNKTKTAVKATAGKSTTASTTAQPIGPVAPASVLATQADSSAAAGGAPADESSASEAMDTVEVATIGGSPVKPVGLEYIEEVRSDDGKTISFNCKLCDCKFNDPNAKEMHMKGRRHRLQYKKKVQPDLVVDIKPNPRQRRLAEAKAERAAANAEFYGNARMHHDGGDDEPMYYGGGGRGYEDDYGSAGGPMAWSQRGAPLGLLASAGMPYGRGLGMAGGPMHMRPQPSQFFGLAPGGRRPESSDDRHVVARHAEIYPKEEELQTIQRIVSHTERALKFVSDALANENDKGAVAPVPAVKTESDTTDAPADDSKADADAKGAAAAKTKEDGRDNQMFSFQKDTEGSMRILRGVMRVGLLAKGLLLRGDNMVQLVVLCGDKPTGLLLDRVAEQFPIALSKVQPEHSYKVQALRSESAVLVSDDTITVKVSLTSPMLRDPQAIANAAAADQAAAAAQGADDLLPREPCLQALAALRHAKWFQARATGLQSCVMVMRILRDLCARTPTWTPLNQYAMELFVEKVIQSAHMPLSPGDCVRRVMEAISTGLLINGPGLLDPCEKDPRDALDGMSKQQREDLTVSAQTFLRFIAFRQIHVVLGMEPLPAPKFQKCPWRFTRKRRRSTTGAAGADANTAGDDPASKVKRSDKTDG